MTAGRLILVGALVAMQSVHAVPRPPAARPGPDAGSTAADGYAPAPQWPTQTRAPRAETHAGIRGAHRRRRTRRRVLLQLPSRRPDDRRRARRAGSDRRRGRQGLGAARGDAAQPVGARAGAVRVAPGSRVRRQPHDLSHLYRAARRRRSRRAAALSRRAAGRARDAVGRRSAAREPQGAAEGRRDRRTRDPGARRHAADHVDAFPPASASTPWTGRSRSSSTATWARCCASTPTGRSRTTIRLSAAPARVRRSTRSASATCRASRSIRAPARCGPASTGRAAATRSTPSTKGRNYGFPVIGYGREYSGKPINGDRTAQAGMEQPVYFWTPDIAPAGIAFYTGSAFPAWHGNLFVVRARRARAGPPGARRTTVSSPRSGC